MPAIRVHSVAIRMHSLFAVLVAHLIMWRINMCPKYTSQNR